MRLTFLRAKEALADKAPEGKLDFRINRLCERLLLHGKFNGSMQRVALLARYGQLALPRYLRTIEGYKVGGYTGQLANRWYEFIPGKYNCDDYVTHMLRDLGDGHAIMYDLPEDGTLALGASDATIRVFGRGADGLPKTQEFEATDSMANEFTSITRIAKAAEPDAVATLTHYTDDLVATPLAIMEPAEEETFYRRYKIDSYATEAETIVTALCKMRHIEFTNDEDVLPFSNISALELGMDALQYEAENDHSVADRYLDKAVDLLNRELADTNSDRALPVIRFQYAPGTTPNFRAPM